MPNQTFALEWLGFAKKNILTAQLLIREKHFTDSIAIEIQQAIEKSLKAVYAYLGNPIPRTHSLMTLFRYSSTKIGKLQEINQDDILSISDYYDNERYPGPRYTQPALEEVEYFFTVAETIYNVIHHEVITSGI